MKRRRSPRKSGITRTVAAPFRLLFRGGGFFSTLGATLGVAAWKTRLLFPGRPTHRWLRRVRLPGFDGYLHLISDQISSYYRIQMEGLYDPFPGFEPGPDWTVVDGGAHIGIFTVVHGQALSAAAGGRVVAFEPDPRSFGVLMKNIDCNDLGDRVTAIQAALFSAEGDCDFISSDYTEAAHIDGFGNVHAGSSRKAGFSGSVRTTTLDAVVENESIDRIDLLKLNVEGAEVDVLEGGRNRALPITRRIILSHESDVPLDRIRELLGEFGIVETERTGTLLWFARNPTA